MSTVAAPASRVQFQFTTLAGLVCRIAGKSAPMHMDELEQSYGQRLVDEVMCRPGEWVSPEPLTSPKPQVFRVIERAAGGYVAKVEINGVTRRVGKFRTERAAEQAITSAICDLLESAA